MNQSTNPEIPLPIDLRVVYGDIVNIHSLHYCTVISEQKKLEALELAHEQFYSLPPEEQAQMFKKYNKTQEELTEMYSVLHEYRKIQLTKAAQAALMYYEIYQDEIQSEAHFINKRIDSRSGE
jgi:UDP-galactopyranose mutase